MDSVRSRLRSWFAWLFHWTASAKAVPAIEQTAWQRAKVDTSSFAAGWPILFGALVTAGVAAGGVLPAVWTSGYTTLVIVVGAVAGALVGFFLVIALVALVCWLLAFPRQRNEARGEVKRLEAAAVAETQQEHVESQFAAALRAGRALPADGPLVLEWMHATVNLVRDTFGTLQAAKLASQKDVDSRLARLDELASELGEGRSPSESWGLHVAQGNAFGKSLGPNLSAGVLLHVGLMDGTADPADLRAWQDDVRSTLALMPSLASISGAASGPAALMTRNYRGVTDPAATNALNHLDDRLPDLEAMRLAVEPYIAAIGEAADA